MQSILLRRMMSRIVCSRTYGIQVRPLIYLEQKVYCRLYETVLLFTMKPVNMQNMYFTLFKYFLIKLNLYDKNFISIR